MPLLFSSFVSYLSKLSSLLHVSEFNTLLDFSVWEAMCILIATNIKFYSNATTTSQANNDKILFCKQFVAVLILLIQVKGEYSSQNAGKARIPHVTLNQQ